MITSRRQAIRQGWRDGYLGALDVIRNDFLEGERIDGSQPDLTSSGWSNWSKWATTAANICAPARWEDVYRKACERGAVAAWIAARRASEMNADGDVFFIMQKGVAIFADAYENPKQNGP